MRHRRIFSCAALFTACCLALCGCQKPAGENEKSAFTICVTADNADYFRGAVKEFRAQNPALGEVKVEFVTLPEYTMNDVERAGTGDETAAFFTQLRTEIMSGQGPDLFLLPSDNAGLFPDVYKSMQAGVFLDLAPLLGDALTNPNLNQTVLAAGEWKNKQYLVPLSYQVPVLLTSARLFEGCDAAASGTVSAFFDALSQHFSLTEERQYVFAGLRYNLGAVLRTPLLDYKTKQLQWGDEVELLLTKGEAARAALAAGGYQLPAFPSEEYPFKLGPSGELFFIKEEEFDSAETPLVLPVPGGEGGVTASVEWYAAVRANSGQAKLAAELIEYLLSQEGQSPNNGIIVGSLPVNRAAAGARLLKAAQFVDLLSIKEDPAAAQALIDQFVALGDAVDTARFSLHDNWQMELALHMLEKGGSIADCEAGMRERLQYYFEE